MFTFWAVPKFALAESPILGQCNFSDLKPTDGIQLGKGPKELGLAEPFFRFILSDDFTLAGMVARIQRTVLPCNRVKGCLSLLRVMQHK